MQCFANIPEMHGTYVGGYNNPKPESTISPSQGTMNLTIALFIVCVVEGGGYSCEEKIKKFKYCF
jgi:hypothetical protein